MALLAIRTTLKPDVGSSPAELVYGEGLAVPGELLPDVTFVEDDLTQQRKRMLGNLRVEVERLQPTPTSRHRQPQTYLPDDLKDATHVFVRRGGHGHPPLTLPYIGPFKVESRTETGFNVHLPGRGVEQIALARIKPAYVDLEDDDNGDSQPPSPQSPQPQQPQQPQPRQPQQPQQPSQTPQPPRPNLQSRRNRRRGAPHIADFNQRQHLRSFKQEQPSSPVAETSNSEPVAPEPGTEDPYDGHTPADSNLAPCQCEPPDNPQAPCNMPVAARPGSGLNDSPTSLPQTVTPHPRPVQRADLNKRMARPNYGPSLSAILKAHLNM